MRPRDSTWERRNVASKGWRIVSAIAPTLYALSQKRWRDLRSFLAGESVKKRLQISPPPKRPDHGNIARDGERLPRTSGNRARQFPRGSSVTEVRPPNRARRRFRHGTSATEPHRTVRFRP